LIELLLKKDGAFKVRTQVPHPALLCPLEGLRAEPASALIGAWQKEGVLDSNASHYILTTG
jgi:hypothetical protein